MPLAPYRTFGTIELAEAAADAIGEKSRAVLLSNHGLVTIGGSLDKAFKLALTCEWCAELEWRCLCAGKPNILSDEAMAEALERFRTYGQKTEGEEGGY